MIDGGRGYLAVFSGVDCSGKSTQVSMLRGRLVAANLEVKVLWFRPGYSRFLNTVRRFVRRVTPRALPSRGDTRRERFFEARWRRFLWVTVALCDTFMEYVVRLRVLLLRYDAVICDRYIDDALIDLDLRFPELAPSNWAMAKLLRRTVPRPDSAVVLTLPWETVLSRTHEKREPFPDPPVVRRKRFLRYQALAGSGRYVLIDSSASRHTVQEEIVRLMRDH